MAAPPGEVTSLRHYSLPTAAVRNKQNNEGIGGGGGGGGNDGDDDDEDDPHAFDNPPIVPTPPPDGAMIQKGQSSTIEDLSALSTTSVIGGAGGSKTSSGRVTKARPPRPLSPPTSPGAVSAALLSDGRQVQGEFGAGQVWEPAAWVREWSDAGIKRQRDPPPRQYHASCAVSRRHLLMSGGEIAGALA